jgi:dephospho-CoA kinase
MIKVGLTGGIGSGKSAVAKIWEDLGAFPLYADDLAKKIMTEDPDVKSEIKKIFGDESYNKDGALNRPYLAKEAFEKGRVEDLNAVVHPVVYRETKKAF